MEHVVHEKELGTRKRRNRYSPHASKVPKLGTQQGNLEWRLGIGGFMDHVRIA
jgi:hypothetical protein